MDPWVPALDAQAQLAALAGTIGVHRIAELSGLHVSRVRRIRAGAVVRIRTSTAAAISRAVAIGSPAPGARRSTSTARQLLRWFRMEGFTLHALAARVGLARKTVACRGASIRYSTERKLAALQRVLSE